MAQEPHRPSNFSCISQFASLTIRETSQSSIVLSSCGFSPDTLPALSVCR